MRSRWVDHPTPDPVALHPIQQMHLLSEIPPFWIVRLDQRDLLLSRPALQLGLAGDGGVYIRRVLHVDKPVHVVTSREAAELLVPVLVHARRKSPVTPT